MTDYPVEDNGPENILPQGLIEWGIYSDLITCFIPFYHILSNISQQKISKHCTYFTDCYRVS